MKPTFQHNLITSFQHWVTHTLCDDAEGFQNKSTLFYPTTDSEIPSSYKIYAAPFKEIVSDNSVNNATSFSGIWLDGNFHPISYNDPNNIFDFANSRFITTGDYTVVSGDYAAQEFNVYMSNEDEEDLIYAKKYKVNSPYTFTETAVEPYSNTVPCAFVSAHYENTPYAMGGHERSSINAQIVFFSENIFQLDSALGIFNDKVRTIFGEINYTNDPFNEFVKGSRSLKRLYNYDNEVNLDPDFQYFIDRVTVSKLNDRAKVAMQQKFFVGFVDLEISRYRYPRG